MIFDKAPMAPLLWKPLSRHRAGDNTIRARSDDNTKGYGTSSSDGAIQAAWKSEEGRV